VCGLEGSKKGLHREDRHGTGLNSKEKSSAKGEDPRGKQHPRAPQTGKKGPQARGVKRTGRRAPQKKLRNGGGEKEKERSTRTWDTRKRGGRMRRPPISGDPAKKWKEKSRGTRTGNNKGGGTPQKIHRLTRPATGKGKEKVPEKCWGRPNPYTKEGGDNSQYSHDDIWMKGPSLKSKQKVYYRQI